MISPSPRRGMLGTLTFSLLIGLFLLHLATAQPVPDHSIRDDGGGVELLIDGSWHTLAYVEVEGVREAVPANMLVEEPDVLMDYSDYNRFMAWQSILHNSLQQNPVPWYGEGGERLPLKVHDRSMTDLPVTFWSQLAGGMVSLCIAVGLWLFRRGDFAVRQYAFMGLGIALASWASAVYTTRHLVFDGQWFQWLSWVNHLGALLFGAGLVSLFWSYPKRLLPVPVLRLAALSWSVPFVIDIFQITATSMWSVHIWPVIYTALALLGAAVQWPASRNSSVDRAILKWLLLSVIGTAMIFVGFNTIPILVTSSNIGPQAVTILGFTLGFVMMALGLGRYRLFNLDRWWYQYWLWLLAGVALVLVDFALIALFGLGRLPALSVSLILVGWLYFPVRDLIWRRLRPTAKDTMNEMLPDIIELIFGARDEPSLHRRWGETLERAFAPLQRETCICDELALVDSGERLRVPSPFSSEGYELAYCHQGGRLFNPQDKKLAKMLYELVYRAGQGMHAREEGMMLERERIKRDLHDDLGARLLSVSHAASTEVAQSEARQAVRDLRDILTALEQTPCAVSEALAIWESESRERCLNQGFELDWQVSGDRPDSGFSARQRHNIGRILRELVSNALRHSGGDRVAVSWRCEGDEWWLTVKDNGRGSGTGDSMGRGSHIVTSRARELGGEAVWTGVDDGGCQCRVRLPLAEPV